MGRMQIEHSSLKFSTIRFLRVKDKKVNFRSSSANDITDLT